MTRTGSMGFRGFVLFFSLSLVPISSFGQGVFAIGARYEGWNSNYLSPFEGSEFWFPMALSMGLDEGIQVFARGQFGSARYTDSFGGVTQSQDLTHFTDTVIGGDLRFRSFSAASVFNIAFNLPTGDPAWEGKQSAANIPTEFVPSRYQAGGFGVNAYYGLAFPTGGEGEFGVAVGYDFTGGYNSLAGLSPVANDLNLGDSIFLAFNHVQPFEGGRSQAIRFNAFYSLATQRNGVDIYQLAPNLNASYAWMDPSGFSFTLGGTYYLVALRPSGGSLEAEDEPFYGPRVYLNPSYELGDLTLTGLFKYVFSSGYDEDHPFHSGGGVLFGLQPSYWAALGEGAGLRLTGSLESITVNNAGLDAGGELAGANYLRWTIGTSYEVNL